MQQANYIKLQQEARDKEKFVHMCYTRMEQGLPPSEETEQEWKRLVREERRRRLEKEKARVRFFKWFRKKLKSFIISQLLSCPKIEYF